jgi:poly-gamma-glutamate capsule biosynthesis protein CapA/YwtB (metallophosphatase superfamily)
MTQVRTFLSFIFLFVLFGALLAYPPKPLNQAERADLSIYPWIYRRQGLTPSADENLVELVAVGDIMLGRQVVSKFNIFTHVASWLVSADQVIGNLESPIVQEDSQHQYSPDESDQGSFCLAAPPQAVALLQNAGFDLLSMANNHAYDEFVGSATTFPLRGGQTCFNELAYGVQRLKGAGIDVIGVGSELDIAYKPVIRRINGIRVAFLAFNTVPIPSQSGCQIAPLSGDPMWQDQESEVVEPPRMNNKDEQDHSDPMCWVIADWQTEQALAAIRTARAQADMVIVSIHWGNEYDLQVDPSQHQINQEMLKAGADLVLGHHPHVVQGTQVFDTGDSVQFTAYSLGNFVFDQYEESTRQGMALRIFLDLKGLRAVQALPIWAGTHPMLMSLPEAATLLERVRPEPKWMDFSCELQSCSFIPVTHVPVSTIFWSGQIDLTGDGQPELVRRQGGRVRIYQDDQLTWQSPPEWQVYDLALGDPNNDGRNELMLALLRPDSSGALTSHPFVIGYRGGAYRQLWGGSAVADPILELELGDVNGDGVQELITVEERDSGLRAVTVWRWHGWGFSLLWRSLEANYNEMGLVKTESQKLVIQVGVEW